MNYSSLAYALRLGVFAFLLTLVTAQAASEPLAESDFAYGVTLEVPDDTGMFRTRLPEALYRSATTTDLADIRVFNGAGQIVPHALSKVPGIESVEQSAVALPWFPLAGSASAVNAPLARFTLGENGRVLQVELSAKDDGSASAAETAEPATPQAYLLDASQLTLSPSKLELEWESPPAAIWATLLVEGSGDLLHWTSAGEGVVASLDRLGQRFERRELPLERAAGLQYFRITSVRGELPKIKRVRAHIESSSSDIPLQNISAKAERLEPNLLRFDLGGTFPLRRLSFELTERNTWAQARVSSSALAEGEYETQFEGAIYRLGEPTPLSSPPIEMPREPRHKYVRLATDPRGGGLGSQLPTLSADYRPDEIIWVARGEGPFTLAYGSAEAKRAAFTATELLGGGRSEKLSVAKTGATRELGGPARLEPTAAEPASARTYVLWGVLILAALMLGGLSLRLARRADG